MASCVRNLSLWTSPLQRYGRLKTLCGTLAFSLPGKINSRSTNCRLNESYEVCRSNYCNLSGPTSERGTPMDKRMILSVDIATNSSINSVAGKYLTVAFDNGEQSRMMAVWLRHNCHCPDCVDPGTNQRKVYAHRLELSPTLKSASLEDNLVHITWQYKDGTLHRGYIEAGWLRDNCYNTTMSYAERMKRNRPHSMTFLPTVQYSDIVSSSEGLWKWLENVNEYGVCLVKGTPVKLGEVEKIAERINYIQETIFGRVWDVKAIEGNDEDVAYGTDSLLLHMDEVYYDGHPGINFLHCIRNDDQVEGGENVIVDAFPVVEEFRKTHPQHFTTLTQIPGTFQRIWKHGNDITEIIKRQKHHIVVDCHGEVIGINWTQHNGGPVYETEENIEKYYEAYIELSKAFETSPFKIQNRPQPGDVLTVNNRRVLHSRTKFTLNGGVRHLQGTYVTIDGFKSKIHVLANKLGKVHPIKRMCDNCSL